MANRIGRKKHKNSESKDFDSKNSGKKIMFVNSRLEKSENNLKSLDSTGDLFLEKLRKLESGSSKISDQNLNEKEEK